MARIGNLGSLITFEVSSNKVLTFEKLSQTVSGRWATHNVIGGKPKPEYIGEGQRTINLPIFLSVNHGIRPRTTMERIEEAVEDGETFTLVIGGKKIGSRQWIISQMSESWGEVIRDGRLCSAHLTLTLQEYT
ncbi:MAG: phage tail protein [Lachnospiraceae bacterium]|nr:phage tail protein [Lachnospiraceae bacterium]